MYTTYTRHPVAADWKAIRIWISQKKRPPRVEPRRASPESGKGSVVSDDQPAATQDTQVDCVHLTLLMYDSPRSRANKLCTAPPRFAPLRRLQNPPIKPNLSRAIEIFIGRRSQHSKRITMPRSIPLASLVVFLIPVLALAQPRPLVTPKDDPPPTDSKFSLTIY